ncbi:nicolin-1 isoform X1 [Bufo bufo]|uniref:nicolin-1 isoform X1 n=1 Tax=Bufo bufo TaxID=8384 RepID=UPI001ABE6197|nr:nicolin-1 isoform X1 [Bufo bufo]
MAVPCNVRAPVPLQVGDGTPEPGRPGVNVIDVTFPSSQAVDVQEISFRNFYTAFLTIKIQQRGATASRKSRTQTWRTCVRNLHLMPNPHMEEGSQDYVSLHRPQMLCEADKVVSLRFVLRQPSPVWLSFTLEELQINPPGRQIPQNQLSWWLSHLPPREERRKLHKGLPDPERVSSEVQRMWALTEVMRSSQSTATVGRFDVDGCYDINLLSYT